MTKTYMKWIKNSNFIDFFVYDKWIVIFI